MFAITRPSGLVFYYSSRKWWSMFEKCVQCIGDVRVGETWPIKSQTSVVLSSLLSDSIAGWHADPLYRRTTKCTIVKKSARMRFESNRIDNPGSNLATNTTNKRNIPLSRRPIMQEAPGAKTGPSWIRSSSLGVHLQLLDVPLARYQRVGLLVAGAEVLHGTTLDLTRAYVNTCRDRPGRFRTVVVAASRFDHYWKRTCAWTRRRWSSRWIIDRLPGGTPERCHTDSPLRGFLPCSASRTGGPLCCGSVRIRTTEMRESGAGDPANPQERRPFWS
jgi:hypothetical protein